MGLQKLVNILTFGLLCKKIEKGLNPLKKGELDHLFGLRGKCKNYGGSFNKKSAKEYIRFAEDLIKQGKDLGYERDFYISISTQLEK